MAANSSFELPPQSLGRDLPLDSPDVSILQGIDSASPELSDGKPSSGLKIRRNFDEQMQQEITRAQAGGNPVALMAIEIDRFGMLDEA